MSNLTPKDLRADKRGYVPFDCSDCRRVAQLQLAVRAYYKPGAGLSGIVAMLHPNDCRAALCGFRIKPSALPSQPG